MVASTQRRDPYMAYNFVVEIEGIVKGGFTEVSGLESEIELEGPHWEGGLNQYPHYFPTHIVYPRLVLSRGLTDVDVLWNWYQNATQGKIQRKNGTIMLYDSRQQAAVMWWSFKQAYPVKWVGPQLNASNATEVAVERLELIHQGLKHIREKNR